MSAVATEDEVTTSEDTAPRAWTRTPEQDQVVADYQAMIKRMYKNADPDYVAELTDPTILGTPELADLLGYMRKTRVFQLYTDLRELADADQAPHPSAMPDTDAGGGHRGARQIRGIMRGRVIHWALQSGRFWYDFTTRTLRPQDGINHGGAPRRD